jgi:hypothetical protein
MRFEAKLTRAIDDWDDEAEDLELPADLAELGEQLQVDSRHLAKLYPSLTGQESSFCPSPAAESDYRKKERRQSAIIFGTGASLVVLLCLTFGIVVSRPQPDEAARDMDHAVVESEDHTVDDTSTPTPSNLLIVTAPIQYEPMLLETDEATGATSYTVPRINVATPLSTKDTSILNATGPQAEAYLDYIEMTSVRNVKLSF